MANPQERCSSTVFRAATVRACPERGAAESNGSRVLAHGETCLGTPNGNSRRKYPASHDAGSACRRLAALAAILLALPLTGGAGPQGADDAATIPQKVQAHLAAAHRARSQLAEEEQAWAIERERLELLVSAVRRRAERFKAETEQAGAARADLQKKVDTLSARKRRLEAVEALLDALAEHLEKDLETLSAETLPGLVPPETAAGAGDPARRFDAAVARLADTRRRLATATVEIVTGTLAGREVTVKLLRAGGAAAWWTSLDGTRAGTARRDGGRLALTPAASPEGARAIRRAFDMAEGRAAPDWIVLPAGHLKVKEDAPGKPGG